MERKYKKMHVLFEESGSALSINLETNKVDNWLFNRGLRTNYKTSDGCVVKFETADGVLHHYSGYVPNFFPDKHYGDYVMLQISKTGEVQQLKVKDEQIDKLLKQYETNDYEEEEDE